MSIQDLTNLLVNNGVAVGCLIYFMVYNSKQLATLNNTLNELKEVITKLNEKGGK